MARLDTGDPFLMEKACGEGRVIVCCTACDADWGNLPLRPFFLPLMQQLVTHLASKVYPPRNVEIGQRLAAFVPPALAGQRAVLVGPDGSKQEVPIAKQEMHGLVEYGATTRPGLYLLELPGGDVIHFVVRTPAVESNPARLGAEALQALAKDMNATVVTTAEEYEHLDQRRRFGREIWVPILWVVLSLLFVELLLIRYVTRRVT
jgi:hypothetical protein